VKSEYRRFNITNIQGGDDYAAMKQSLLRHYMRLLEEANADTHDNKFPDVLLIDGGKGQLTQALEVMGELQISNILVVGVAKGSTRKAGFETLVLVDRKTGASVERMLDGHDSALHLIQQVRDEAHRFAITGHKQRRDKKRQVSTLENIPGIGATRRRELLRFFGGQQQLARAGTEELMRVPGISRALAQAIYDAYHEN